MLKGSQVEKKKKLADSMAQAFGLGGRPNEKIISKEVILGEKEACQEARLMLWCATNKFKKSSIGVLVVARQEEGFLRNQLNNRTWRGGLHKCQIGDERLGEEVITMSSEVSSHVKRDQQVFGKAFWLQ